jgi:hypothetical protein
LTAKRHRGETKRRRRSIRNLKEEA